MSRAFDGVYPIGLGTAHFPFPYSNPYEENFENAVELVLYALKRGVNYIDVGQGYSGGHALPVLKEALGRTEHKPCVTVKVQSYNTSLTAEDYYRESCSVLKELGLEYASHFLLWTLMDASHFHRVTKSGSLYDAALRLKEEGRIGHIGASLHMSPNEMIEVMDSGLFEFLLISCNLVKLSGLWQVLDHALEKGVDILVMNPLYGGLIPRNPKMFDLARFSEEETVVQAAIRALLSHPAVKCVLAGASSREQLDAYLSAAEGFDREKSGPAYQKALRERLTMKGTFCSYCRYCADCPQGIPVPELMNARNLFSLQRDADRSSVGEVLFRQLHEQFKLSLETWKNPCVQCGKCEKVCTQHLPIISSVAETYAMAGQICADKDSRRRRLKELLRDKGYRKVGFWPASGGTSRILELYRELLGEPPFEVLLFDSNKDRVGQEMSGCLIHGKDEAVALGLDCMLITSYQYGGAIYSQIRDLEAQGIAVKMLYRPEDADWWWC